MGGDDEAQKRIKKELEKTAPKIIDALYIIGKDAYLKDGNKKRIIMEQGMKELFDTNPVRIDTDNDLNLRLSVPFKDTHDTVKIFIVAVALFYMWNETMSVAEVRQLNSTRW